MTEPNDLEAARRLPPLNALRVFEAAARLSSFAQAAEELSVTPGAVSQQIRILENHAGAPLFIRQGRRVVLTELGRTLDPVVRDGFNAMRRAADLIYGPAMRRSLTVSVPPSFAVKWLVPRMSRFSQAHPEIEVWISADMQPSDVAGGRADVAVRYGLGHYPDVRTRRLADAGVIPVCSPTLMQGTHPLRRPADLAHHTLIHLRRSQLEEPRPDWAAWLASRKVKGVDAAAGPAYDQTLMTIEAAAHGRGVALAPKAFVADDLASGRLIAPFADGYLATNLGYHVLTRKTGVSDHAQTFVRWLLDEKTASEEAVDEL